MSESPSADTARPAGSHPEKPRRALAASEDRRGWRDVLRYPRLEILLVAAGVVAGASGVVAAFHRDPKPAAPPAAAPAPPSAPAAKPSPSGAKPEPSGAKPAPPATKPAADETLEEIGARVLAESRAARRRLEPAVARATGIAREVERRYRLPDGRSLRISEVTSTLPVASIEIVAGNAHWSVATDNGIFFELCGRGMTRHCVVQRPGRTALLARSQALELALRTFRETRASVVVVSLPQRAAQEAWLVFERSALSTVDSGALLRRLHPAEPRASSPLARRIDRLTLGRLFTPAGLVPHTDTTDSVVAVPLGAQPS